MHCLKFKTVTTRKPHKCFCCLRVFESGSRMQTWAGIYDGDFSHGYNCITCGEIMKREDSDEGFPEGYFHETKHFRDQTPEEYLQSITEALNYGLMEWDLL